MIREMFNAAGMEGLGVLVGLMLSWIISVCVWFAAIKFILKSLNDD